MISTVTEIDGRSMLHELNIMKRWGGPMIGSGQITREERWTRHDSYCQNWNLSVTFCRRYQLV